MVTTDLLVIGAGPYGLSVAAHAIERGIDTVAVGQPMAFWRDCMPGGMFLRSGPDWHLDAVGTHTLQAYLAEHAIRPDDVDPIPVGLFIDYAEWFRAAKGVDVRPAVVTALGKVGGQFEAVLDSGERIVASAAVAAPGVGYFTSVPGWAGAVPSRQSSHTCDLVCFDGLSGARVLIIGGRQSAYEWAALLAEHGARRIDVVHRHEVPRFARVSWAFVDEYTDATLRVRGWWRRLPASQQAAINRRFWEAGRRTLEYWLSPRLQRGPITSWPGTEVVHAASPAADGTIIVTLSNGERLGVDYVVFATGYHADLSRVPYLSGVLDGINLADGLPMLGEGFCTSLDELYVTGFPAAHAFGPFLGFAAGAPAAATLIVGDLLAR